MQPTKIEGHTNVLGAPPNWDETKHGSCGALPVRVSDFQGLMSMTSAWRPTEEELARLNAGAPVHLTVVSGSHPPVIVAVASIKPDPQQLDLPIAHRASA